jgi:hypothetical protein
MTLTSTPTPGAAADALRLTGQPALGALGARLARGEAWRTPGLREARLRPDVTAWPVISTCGRVCGVASVACEWHCAQCGSAALSGLA